MDEVKKLTIKDIRRTYEEKEPMSWISIYDYPMAYYADQAGIDVIFVGDSSTTTVLGYPNTLYASMDQMIMFAGAVTRAVKHAFVIGDLPYRSYQASVKDAVRNAMRYMAEGHVDAVEVRGRRRGVRPDRRDREMGYALPRPHRRDASVLGGPGGT
mgnify:CR=1 FL=1